MPSRIRNQLHGTVKSMVSDKILSEVNVETPAGLVASVITTASLKALKLKKGDAVRVLIKATNVSLAKTEFTRRPVAQAATPIKVERDGGPFAPRSATIMSDKRSLSRQIKKVADGKAKAAADQLALEEPLEIQLAYGAVQTRKAKTIAITMRTPGHDRELAAGFLIGEGLLRSLDQIEAVHSRGPRYGENGWQHSVRVTLRPEISIDLTRLERNFYTTSSCGVCGKTSLEALEMNIFPPLSSAEWRVDESVIRTLPAKLRESQAVFERTGGLHGAGLFSPAGLPLVIREDVGRHNAVDKVIGAQFLSGKGPLSDCLLVVSGRASFELMQKAIASGIPMLVAVGAPSSLAVEVAEKFGATLIGFTKASGFNIYTEAKRVRFALDGVPSAAKNILPEQSS